jgi:N4-gp56 family major capsid protein
LPYYNYIGTASTVAEGSDIPVKTLAEQTVTAQIHKIGIGVQLTDESVLSGYGNPVEEAVRQLTLSIASGVDDELLTTMSKIATGMTYTSSSASAITSDDIADSLVLFGEDIDGEKVLLLSPADYAVLRKSDDWIPNTEIGADMIIKGTVGMVHGCQVVVSNKLTAPKTSYIVKPGALAIYMKRDTLVETDRDIVNKSTIMTADKHFVTYLYDATKAIKLVKKSS